uniref:Secreted RxLR effector peptide protein n=1 Tax=Panagrellus redivivus TaxID=6233 RepID=A0A7E4VT66_PANRE
MVSVHVFILLLVAVGLALLAMPVNARHTISPSVFKAKEIKGSDAEMHGEFLDVDKQNVVDRFNWDMFLLKQQTIREGAQ